LGCTSNRLILAAWPRPGSIDEDAVEQFARVQEIVSCIRELKNSQQIDAKKPVDIAIVPINPSDQPSADGLALIESLSVCNLKPPAELRQPSVSSISNRAGRCD